MNTDPARRSDGIAMLHSDRRRSVAGVRLPNEISPLPLSLVNAANTHSPSGDTRNYPRAAIGFMSDYNAQESRSAFERHLRRWRIYAT